MDLTNLSNLINSNLSLITEKWINEVKSSTYMQTYQTLTDEDIKIRGERFYSHFLEWIKAGASDEKIGLYFFDVGKERLEEGIPLTEIQYAIFLAKRVFWDFLSSKDELERFLISAKTCELVSLINNYFDIGSFFIIKGYLNQFFNTLDETKKFTKNELQDYFLKGALYKETQINGKKEMFDIYGQGISIGIIK